MQYMTATNGPDWPNPPHSTFLLRKLLENQSYKNAFINRFSLLVATYLSPTRVSERRNELMAQIQSEISYDQQKWGSKSENGLPSTISNFNNNRQASMQNEIKTFFGLSNAVDFTISIEGSGKILVHNLPVLNGSATFKAYPEIPIEIEASGSGFKRWSDGNTSPKRTVDITEAMTLRAEF
jgi:hypothetical protein